MSCIIILGAGASIPFYSPKLTTDYLTKVVLDTTKWNDIVIRYNNSIPAHATGVDVSVVQQVFHNVSTAHRDYNFEQILEIVDKISSFSIDPYSDSKVLHGILQYYKAQVSVSSEHAWDCVPFLARQIIAEEVSSLHMTCKSYDYTRLTQLQEQFLASICDEGAVNIFTLNYDEIIFDAVAKLGFQLGFDSNDRFDIRSFIAADRSISFPHGHSRFSYDDYGMLYHHGSEDANKYRLSHIGLSNMSETKYLTDSAYSYSFNTFISTGQQKEPTFDVNPFAAYYQKFASDCLKSNKIIVVGYSFSDSHFNRMLLNYLSISSSNKVIIIDYIPQAIDIQAEFVTSGSFINRMFNQLGVNSIPMDGLTHKYKYYQAEHELNMDGYAEILPQIVLYKKGYDAYLNEFNSIKV